MSTNTANIGARVAELRERLNMSRLDLQDVSGIPAYSLGLIETGERSASTLELSLIAGALGVSVSCLRRSDTATVSPLADYPSYALALEEFLDQLAVPSPGDQERAAPAHMRG